MVRKWLIIGSTILAGLFLVNSSSYATGGGITGGSSPITLNPGDNYTMEIKALTGCTLQNLSSARWIQMTETSSPLSPMGLYTPGSSFTFTAPTFTSQKTFDFDFAADFDCSLGTTRGNGVVQVIINATPIITNGITVTPDATVYEGESVTFTSSLVPTCSYISAFNGYWYQVNPTFPDILSGAVTTEKFITLIAPTVATDTTYTLGVQSTPVCGTYSVASSGSVNLTIRKRPAAQQVQQSGGGGNLISATSNVEKMFEGEKIEKISIKLQESPNAKGNTYALEWNDIGGDFPLRYEIEYADNIGFSGSKRVDAYGGKKIFQEQDLPERPRYFFRIRATYSGKYSPWSNILGVYNNSNYLRFFIINPKKYLISVRFDELLEKTNRLIARKAKLKK